MKIVVLNRLNGFVYFLSRSINSHELTFETASLLSHGGHRLHQLKDHSQRKFRNENSLVGHTSVRDIQITLTYS